MRRLISAFSVSVVSAVLLALHQNAASAGTLPASIPALPALSATLKATPPAYSGPCPTTIKFEATVSGPAGTSITYQFAHIVGGSTSLTSWKTDTIPAAGVITLSDAMTVAASQAGVASEVIRVKPGDISTTLKVIVGCVGPSLMNPGSSNALAPAGPGQANPGVAPALAHPTPTPIPNMSAGGFNARPVAPPRNLSNTTDPGVCSNHFPVPLAGPLACAAAIQQLLALIWDWTPYVCQGCPADVDGYKIYRVDGGQHALIATQNQGTHVTVYGVDKPNDGTYTGKCYVVTAYKGPFESFDSNRFCVGALVNIGTKIVSMQATSVLTTTQATQVETGFGCTGGTVVEPIGYDSSKMRVGHQYGSLPAGGEICWWHFSRWSRAGAYFDLSNLAGKKVLKASLHIPSQAGWTEHGAHTPNSVPWYSISDPVDSACITEIGTGADYWWNSPRWLDMHTFDTRSFYGKLDFDVTSQVRSWTMGAANYGFVFRSSDEGQIVNDERWHCWSTFSNKPILTIEYFP